MPFKTANKTKFNQNLRYFPITLSLSLFLLSLLSACSSQQINLFAQAPEIQEQDHCPIEEKPSALQHTQISNWISLPSESLKQFDPEHQAYNFPLIHSHPLGPIAYYAWEPALFYADEKDQESIWPKLRSKFQLNLALNNNRISSQRNWYARHQAYLNRVFTRATPYLYYISEELEKRDMPMELALLPLVESAYDPFAYSHSRASGIWQFIPGTGKMYGLQQNWWYDGRRDIIASTDAALNYLSHLSNKFDGDWLLALAAYNSGSGRVSKAIRNNKRKGLATDFWSLSLPRETRAYVPKLLAIAQIVNDPSKHGVSLKPIPNTPYFEKVYLEGQIDLAQAAKLADMKINELYQLNPGFNRWATAPNGPNYLLSPISKATQLREGLSQLDKKDQIKWTRYKIKSGDSLSTIANKFGTKAYVVKQVNNLSSTLIRAGDTLLIPSPSYDLDAYSLSSEQRRRNKRQKAVAGRHKTIHRVRRGESLWSISQKYNVSITQLAQWNGIAKRDPLQINQKVTIWSPSQTRSASTTNPNMVKKVNYRVRKGDSLARIAQKFNVRVAQLTEWNQLEKSRYLHPGQSITVFVDITRVEI